MESEFRASPDLPESGRGSPMPGQPDKPVLSVPPSFYKRSSPLRSSLRKRDNKTNGQNTTTSSANNIRQKSPGRKTVSFCSDKKISNVNDCFQIMQNGTELIKLRTNVRQFRRVFSLDADLAYIRWTPTNKKPHKARIAVDSIKEVRIGWNTENLRATENNSGEIQDDCAFSIIYGDDYEVLDLIALTADDANVWVVGLMALSNGSSVDGKPSSGHENSSGHTMANLRERWLTSVFNEADTDHKGYISEKSAVRLIRSINNRLLTNRIKQKIKEAGAANPNEALRGRIDCNTFVEVYKDVGTRPEVYFLMVRYANKDYLSCSDLQIFLEAEQGIVGVTREFCQNIIDQCEPSLEAKENNYMTIDGFTNYLISDSNSIFEPAHQKVHQDMDQSMSRYFIATSYNTYLVEDQLKGPSSVDGYISTLKRNCRFIELDLWEPGEEDGDEPVIHHGGTLTTKLKLVSVLSVINELAFERSRYPLFIRLEIHLSIDWQMKLYELLKKHLGAKLYNPSDDPLDWTLPENMPTPKKFLNKIILSGARYETRRKNGGNTLLEALSGEVTEEDEGCDILTGKPKKEKRLELCRELCNLLAPFVQSKHLKELVGSGLDDNLSAQKHIVSMSENNCLKMIHTQSSTFGQLYRNFMLRVTPNVARVDSSNLNPQEFWNSGINFVAMNYQTPGLMMDLQEGKFAANGGCGYVLKPPIMCDEVFSPTEKMPFAPQILHLKILSAQQLARPRGSTAKGDSADPFVVVEIFGIPPDCAEERTKTIRNDIDPNFDESFQFEVCVPELALIRFLVLDDEYIGDDFIGQYTIPFECLTSGYRHVPLLNNEGDPLESTLFVHIAITNRRGGGKAKKRGMSVKRKTTRVQTGMKMVGIKSVDELFRLATAPLVEFIEMKSQLEAALIIWQEECGLGPTGTMRQGLRLIHSRIATAASNSSPPSSPVYPSSEGNENVPSFLISQANSNPFVKTLGVIPEPMLKTFTSLEQVLQNCEKVTKTIDGLLSKLTEATAKISECNTDLPQLCLEAGLRSQKSIRACENFAWNVRLLKAQLTLMHKTQTEANDTIFQVVDTAKSLGVYDSTKS